MINEEGYTTEYGASIKWEEINCISAYKLDAITKIITYLTFDYSFGEIVEINSDDNEFDELLTYLGNHFDLTEKRLKQIEDLTSESEILILWKRSHD